MRVVVLPGDESACGLYRLRYPAGVVSLARPDWTVEVYRPSDVRLGLGEDGRLWAIYGIPEPDKIDVMVLQRSGTSAQVQLIEWAQRQGIAVVLDSDDAMWAIDPENVSYGAWNRQKGSLAHWQHLERAALMADLVTVTTPLLAQRYGRKHGRVEVLPNCVPEEAVDLPSIREDYDPAITLGWAGFTSTHPHDLQVVGDAVARIVEEFDVRVRVVGDAAGAGRAWGLPFGKVEPVGPVQMGAAYLTALTCIDIALVPLADTTFNRAKSALKALEFRTMGVPVVASPTPDNRRLAAEVPNISLAGSPDEWYDALRALALDERGHVGRGGHSWTYEARSDLWAAAWERAYTRRQRLSA